jgi:VWFA-related protein
LKERYEIVEAIGSTEEMAAYVITDLPTQEPLLLWESSEVFKLSARPPGIREYFQHEDKHYLVLQIEGQTLAFMLTIAGRLDEKTVATWMFQICQAIGYWHNRENGRLICLHQGALTLSLFRLSSSDQVMIPSYGDFGHHAEPILAADAYRFSAPENDPETLSPASDVYALGAMLYCLLVGQPPPEPEAILTRKAKLVSPRKLNRNVSNDMEKIVLKALQCDPRRRYPTAAEMATDLLEKVIGIETEETESERKPSFLMRHLPYILAVLFIACLFAAFQAFQGPSIDITFLGIGSTATPAPSRPPADTPTPGPTRTPIPAMHVAVNQVRTDQFPTVIAYISVLNQAHEPVMELTRSQFTVNQDGTNIADFRMETVGIAQDPLAMVVAIDISGSMNGEPLEKARIAAAEFVRRFDALDEVALVKFDDQIELVHDFTTDKEPIVEAINSLRPRGDTAIYDVLAYSVEHLNNRQGRRALILLTDGRDTASVQHTLDSSITTTRRGSIPVFVIGLDSSQFTPETMERISMETGGEYLFAPTPGDLDALYQKIRGQLQNQYRFEFMSRHGGGEGTHTLSVGLLQSEEQVLWGEKQYQVH